MFCWFATVSDRMANITKCLPLYSQPDYALFGWSPKSRGNITTAISLNPTFEDYEWNGRYCQSGLANPIDDFTARCVSTTRITDKD